MEVFSKIREWGLKRDLYEQSSSPKQLSKLLEEVGELAQAIAENDEADVVDAIGDCIVVLTHIAKFNGYSVEACIEHAYQQIKGRRGLMLKGKFVKYEDLSEEHKAIVDARQPLEPAA